MTAAAARLADLLIVSGARRVAFVGLAKNVGKTTALVAMLEELHRRAIPAGTTSAARDGEAFDAITGEPKPRFRVFPRQIVASAAATFEAASFPTRRLAALPVSTRFGPIEAREAEGTGEIEVVGPSTASQMAATAAALESAGARVLLLDGAVGRRAVAAARVADAVGLSIGLAAGASLDAVLAAAGAAVELIRLSSPPPGASVCVVSGALTDAALRDRPPLPGQTLVAEDFTSIFLAPESRRELARKSVTLAVSHPTRLLALTANPTAPARQPLAPARFLEALCRRFPDTPVFDLVSDLSSG